MLKSLTLTHWKSFGAVRNELRLSPLTLLVGPNGSGKSNALDALRFLQGAALDFPLGDVLRGRWEGQREIWPAIRGQVVEAARSGHKRFEIASHWSLGETSLTHAIAVDTSKDALLDSESLIDPEGRALFTTDSPDIHGARGRNEDGTIRVAYWVRDVGLDFFHGTTAERSFINAGPLRAVTTNPFEPGHEAGLREFRASLRAMAFLAIDPARTSRSDRRWR